MAIEISDSRTDATRPFLITFSGIDGAGKTTQIERLSSCLERRSFKVLRLSFWDHVAVWSRIRAGVGRRSSDGDVQEEGNGFVPKNNKHVRKWYLSTARSALYLLDVARLRHLFESTRIRTFDVVIFDRYIYDQIANIYSRSAASRIYGKILLHRAPVPDLAFILDASPSAAFARKPEYPLEFVCENRQNFLQLRELAPQLITIPDADAQTVSQEIREHLNRSRLARTNSLREKPKGYSKPL